MRKNNLGSSIKKFDRRFFLAVSVLTVALTATVFVNQIEQDDSTADFGKVNADFLLASSMPEIVGGSRSSSSWFCPGVPGLDKSVSGEIVVANAAEVPITGKITFLSSDGPAVSATLVIQPFSQNIFDAKGGRRSKFVSAIVELDSGFAAVEQRIIHPAGDSVALCANKPSDSWFFADGFTGAESLFNILLTNPFPDATVVDVSFVTAEGKREPASLKGLIIEPESVYSLAMDEQGARNEAVLAVIIRATTGRLVAGKLQHFLGRGRLGYTSALGAPSASRQWWFAGGQKNLDTDEQLVVLNPTDQDKSVSVAFLTGVGEEIFREPLVLTIPAGRVTTLATSTLPAITDGRYGIFVSSITDDFVTGTQDDSLEYIVVEQVLSRKVEKKTGTTVTLGAPFGAPSKTWTIPSGVPPVGGSLVVANTTSLNAKLRFSTIGPAGLVAIEGLEQIELGAAGVVEVKIPATATGLQLVLESDAEVVVQREVTRGHDLVGVSSVLSLPYRSTGINVQGNK